jgi:RNA polymerase sigma-70 factor (ECF subfamily)
LTLSWYSADASDVELLQRIQRGDGDAIGLLYDRYAPALLAIAFRILCDRAGAEDVVHDAFVIVGGHAEQYAAERGTVVGWIVTLVRNLSIDQTRRRTRRGAIMYGVLPHEPVVPVVDPECLVSGAMERHHVRCALQALSCAHRRTLESVFFEGLNYSEIAKREGVPLGTIKSRAARALASLRDVWMQQSLAEGAA